MRNYLFKNYKRFTLLFSVALGFLLLLQAVNQAPVVESILLTFCTFAPIFGMAAFLSNNLLPKAMKKKQMGRFCVWLLVMSILMGAVFASVTTGFYRLELAGVFEPSDLLNSTQPFPVELSKGISSMIIINLVFCGVRFYYENTLLEKEHLESQLHALQEQISPHLMFNVLNHIHILMKKNVDMADELLLRYSDILRYQLYECNKSVVLLEKEVEFLKDAVEVEKIRWGQELEVRCQWNIENGNTEIAPLLLIPFVENAFKHVSRLPSETGYVHIDFQQTANTLRLTVENSRTNQAPQRRNASGLGMDNLRKRLEILYPGKHELNIRKGDGFYQTELRIIL